MPKVIFVAFDGAERSIAVADGTTARDAAVNNSVPGIDGDCGGVCACATCHVYVDPAWIARTGPSPKGSMEADLLQFAEGVREESRLACQISITEKLDGLKLHLPERQH